ncbi:hypothetical protein T01_15404 [Trichinella spiralis]|uniref:Uncharacterized protein n=1 Tax=Trichinella spiralis TaxID=6334 RepID=A0A0V1AQL6_TRISP|nr:hypothetical protein T01_15404 [Trichinella spiralis]
MLNRNYNISPLFLPEHPLLRWDIFFSIDYADWFQHHQLSDRPGDFSRDGPRFITEPMLAREELAICSAG